MKDTSKMATSMVKALTIKVTVRYMLDNLGTAKGMDLESRPIRITQHIQGSGRMTRETVKATIELQKATSSWAPSKTTKRREKELKNFQKACKSRSIRASLRMTKEAAKVD